MEAFALLGVGAALVPIGIIVLVILAVVGGRNEPDLAHERPAAIYYGLVQFIAVFVVLFSAFAVTSSLLNLTTDDNHEFRYTPLQQRGFQSFSQDSDGEVRGYLTPRRIVPREVLREDDGENDEDLANAARAGVVLVLVAGLYVFHDRRRPRYTAGTPGRRVYTGYLYAVCFVAVLTALAAGVAALFNLLGVIAPGVFGADRRTVALRDFFAITVLAAGAGALFWWHLRRAEPPPAPPAPPPPAAEPPPAPPRTTAVAKKTRAPRKKATP